MSLRYREYVPAPDLAPYVRLFWTLEGGVDDAPPVDRIFPDGCMELVFNLGQPFSAVAEDGRETVQPACFLVGQMSRAVRVRPSRRAAVVGVRFRPGGAHPLLRVPQHELTDSFWPLEDVWPGLARERWRQGGLAAALAAVQTALSAAVARAARPDRRVAAVADTVVARGGAVSVEQLSHQCGLGPRQLERLFRDAVGVGPKRLARIVRFQAALRVQQSGAHGAAVAHAAGYADQAHFVREFRAIAGITPSAFAEGTEALASAFAADHPRVGFVQDQTPRLA